MKRVVFLLVLVFGIFRIQAQSELESGKIVFNNSDIQLDGELNERVWKNLIPDGGFLNYMPNNGDLATHKTEVKMFHIVLQLVLTPKPSPLLDNNASINAPPILTIKK